jgi:hypothetical protein
MLLELGIQPGQTYFVDTNNTTTENTIKKCGSKNVTVNNKWHKIQDLLLLHQINIRSRRVSSEENRADRLSRGDARDMVPEREMFLRNFPSDPAEIFTQTQS